MKLSKRWLPIVTLLSVATHSGAQVNIHVDASSRGANISPTHYGIFFEDINHAADGGLYAELIRNRSFEDDSLLGTGDGRITAWRKVGRATLALTQSDLLNEVQHNALCLTTSRAGDGMVNEGFWATNRTT